LIYPGRRAILSAAGFAPLALLLGVMAPAFWYVGLAALVFLLALMLMDGLLASDVGDIEVICDAPGVVSVGAQFEIATHLRFSRRAPEIVELAIGSSPRVEPVQSARRLAQLQGTAAEARFEFTALRRGEAPTGPLWLRWQGPLGLIWKQKILPIGQPVVIAPDIRPVREHTAQMLHRDVSFGQVAQLQVGEGAEFDALADYRPGMDKRSIDWKQSARHTMLLAKEFRTERNNTIMMAVDAGRAMCEPLAGLPRVDRAVSAALLTAFVALRGGDRVGFFGFDSHPRVASNAVSGQRAFALLQRVAAQIDYSPNETNYTLALATLAERLQRRSLIIIFTDFTDTVSAELMLHAVGTLLGRHLVLFVVMRDEELETVVEAEPKEPPDVTRAVTAAALLRQRRLVVARLRRLGVHVLECRHDESGPALVNAYLEFKRRSLL
jgi:uncharacterized protein (DUF58 family)